MVLITTSTMLETGKRWIDEWESEGISVSLVSMPTIKPFDSEYIKELCKTRCPIITLEEHNVIGGLGSAVAEVIAENNISVKFRRIGIEDIYSHNIGSANYLRKKFGLLDKPKLSSLNDL